MVLQFQKIISPSKAVEIFLNAVFCFLIKPFYDKARHFARKTCRKRNNTLMVLVKNLHIDTRLIIIPLCKTNADNLHQIRIPDVIFCQQNQVVIPVLTTRKLLIKTRIRRHIHLTAENRLDTVCPCFLIKINDTVHHSVVRDCAAVHAKLLNALDIFLYFI